MSISRQVAGRWFTPAYRTHDPGSVARFVATLEGLDPEGYAGCCEAIAAMGLRPSLAAISAPALVIAGAEDPATQIRRAARSAHQGPAGRLDALL